MPGHLGRAVRSGYLRQVQSAPATWRWLLHAIERHERVAAASAARCETTEGGLLDIAADGPDAIVSTHPFASQALGHLRATRTAAVPGHDLPHRHVRPPALGAPRRRRSTSPSTTSRRARRWRSARGRRPSSSPPCPRRSAGWRTTRGRGRRHGAPRAARRERLALVTGGSCGIGRLFESARDIAATGVATPVVLCGTNARLLGRVRERPRHGRARLGRGHARAGVGRGRRDPERRRDDVAGDAAAGVPMITYRCIAGHGETNAAALETAGIAPWVRDPDDLGVALLRALHAKPMGCRVTGATCPTSWTRCSRPRRSSHDVRPGRWHERSRSAAGVAAGLQLLPALTRSPRCGVRCCRAWPGAGSAGTSR